MLFKNLSDTILDTVLNNNKNKLSVLWNRSITNKNNHFGVRKKKGGLRVKLIIIFDGVGAIDGDFYVKGHVYCPVDQKEERDIYEYNNHNIK